MKRKRNQLIVLCVLLAVSIIAFFVLKSEKTKEEEAELAKSPDGDYIVISIDSAAVTGLTIENDKGNYTFSYEGGGWVSKDDATLELDQDKVMELVRQTAQQRGMDRITSVTDYEQYGLAQPRIRVILTADGNETVLAIGDTNEAVERVYLYVQGSDTVYTASKDVVDRYDIEPEALVKQEEEDGATEDTAAETTEEDSADSTTVEDSQQSAEDSTTAGEQAGTDA